MCTILILKQHVFLGKIALLKWVMKLRSFPKLYFSAQYHESQLDRLIDNFEIESERDQSTEQ